MTAAHTKTEFNQHVAPQLAAELGFTVPWKQGKVSSHFSYFADDERLLIVAGEATGKNASLALAYGLTWGGDRRLELALPTSHAFATTQRAAWLAPTARPRIHLHDDETIFDEATVSPDAACDALAARIPAGNTPAADLRAASAALHLGACSSALAELTDWATSEPGLDPAHRQSYRAWHHMGQSVLEISGSGRRATIRAGINDKHGAIGAHKVTVTPKNPLTADELSTCKEWVHKAMTARRAGGSLCKPDEHWLQAVLRADPRLAGVEQPALREVPAWRPPSDPDAKLARGYIDLVGLDGNGDIRVVETKLAANDDLLLILQGLDYYTWAQVYAQPLRERLGASDSARIKLCYLIGSTAAGGLKVSQYAQAQADAIDPAVAPTFLGITDWFAPDGDAQPTVTPLDPHALPT